MKFTQWLKCYAKNGRLFKEPHWIKMFIFNHNEWDRYWWCEQTKSFGKNNPDKTFLIIRRRPSRMGLLTCYIAGLIFIKEKLDSDIKNLCPIVDMKTHYYPLMHNSKKEKNKKNAWEYYFEQPCGMDLIAIKKSKNVIFSRANVAGGFCGFHDDTKITEELLKEWYDIDEKYFKIQPALKDRFDSVYEKFLAGKRVLGTIIREGYMVLAASRDAGNKDAAFIGSHPKQPSINEIMDDVEKRMKDWNCDYVFVSAETTLVIEEFKKRFGDKVLFTERDRREISDMENYDNYKKVAQEFNKTHSRVSINEDYLEEVYLMSKCTVLCAGKCSASIVAALWNRGEYEHMEIIQKGLY